MDLTLKIKELSKLNPKYTAMAIFVDWATIFFTIYYAEMMDHILIYLLAVIIIGSRMHALGILSHDFVHYRFINNRKLSDLIGNIFLCWPLFFTLEGYRAQHLRHHSKLNTDEDPDFIRRIGLREWSFPMTKFNVYWMFFKDLSGLNVLQYPAKIFTVKKNNKKIDIKENYLDSGYVFKMLSFYLFVAVILTSTGLWTVFVFYWVIPIATSLKLIKRIRAVAEHFAVPMKNYDEVTRTTISSGIERYLIGAHNVGYHTEHHRFSSVPWYNLEKLHQYAKTTGELSSWGHISHGYMKGLVQEMQGQIQSNLVY